MDFPWHDDDFKLIEGFKWLLFICNHFRKFMRHLYYLLRLILSITDFFEGMMSIVIYVVMFKFMPKAVDKIIGLLDKAIL